MIMEEHYNTKRKIQAIPLKELKKMGCLRYGMRSRSRRVLGYCLMMSSLVIPDLSIGIVMGCMVLGLNVRLIAKDKIKWGWDSVRLRW